ncbi:MULTISPECIES: chorismate--pyruvate lyase family protein [Microbulbifer]|uniref:Probable chorismate pyruvate-lyase n=1 Tax=Microbulbifer celer TaxID=435905 RepID=A0ABW3UAP1_9GAMM|nr:MULTISPECIES: chorismate lyase [Microbulbifer]UFN57091.1 chorismate lyase [Microbulbifer celer]
MYHSPYESPYLPVGDWHPQPLENLYGSVPPENLVPWLIHPGSLTAALKDFSNGEFSVRILHQDWQQPRLEERRALNLRDRSLALVREVLLCGHGQPWVYARSVLPERSVSGKLRHLRNLDSRPLGELLFSRADMKRGPIVLNQLQRNSHCAIDELAEMSTRAWGRRSTFWLKDKPLLVAETFLNSFNPQTPPATCAPR